MEKLEPYIVRRETMALLPCDAPDGSLQTIVVEDARVFRALSAPLQIVRDSCTYFGVTYHGRKKGAALMGYKSMPPICICSELGIYFFPLMSETRRDCTWLAHSHIRQWESAGEKHVLVHMTHGQRLKLSIHLSAFVNKVMRTAQYQHQMRTRITPYPYQSAENHAAVGTYGYAQSLKVNERGTYSFSAESCDLSRT